MATPVVRNRRVNNVAGDNQWRQDITRRVEELGAANQATAIILERIQNILANQAADILELRAAPASARASVATISNVVSTSIGAVGLLVSGLGCLVTPFIAGGISLAVGVAVWLITTH